MRIGKQLKGSGIRSGLLVALGIPFSFMFAFMVVNLLGYTYNFMVMFGMLLGLGMLIDGAIKHFPEWWLLGTSSTSHWGWHTAFDVTNQYVLEAVRGGLAGLVLFVGSIVCAYVLIGRTVRFAFTSRALAEADRRPGTDTSAGT